MGKKVKICGVEYEMACSVLTLATFKNCFGMDEDMALTNDKIVRTFKQIEKEKPKRLTKEEENKLSDEEKQERQLRLLKVSTLFQSIILDALKMAYAMIKECDINFMPYETWFASLTNVLSDKKWISEVLGLYASVFRGVLQAEGESIKQ